LNFDYGVKKTVNTVVVQMKENFLERILLLPEMNSIKTYSRKQNRTSFLWRNQKNAGDKLKALKNATPL
jgi:hypothetical protein